MKFQYTNKDNGLKEKNSIVKMDRLSPGQGSHVLQVVVDRYQTSVREANKIIKISTWNIRTLFQKGKYNNAQKEMERLKIDILGLSEVRWLGAGECNMKNGGKFVYSGGVFAEHGVGIMLGKSTVKSLMGY